MQAPRSLILMLSLMLLQLLAPAQALYACATMGVVSNQDCAHEAATAAGNTATTCLQVITEDSHPGALQQQTSADPAPGHVVFFVVTPLLPSLASFSSDIRHTSAPPDPLRLIRASAHDTYLQTLRLRI